MSLLLTLAVCLTWLILVAGFCGIGVACLRRVTGLEPEWRNAYLAVWAGFGLVIAGLLVWHFFLPVNAPALWLFLLLAVFSLVRERRWFAAIGSRGVSIWLVLAIGVFAIWTANHALAPPGVDDFNYEFQAIRWFHDYSIVPGLANLHGRLGFNNSHHLFAAMLSSGPWSGKVNHVCNGLFVVLAFVLLADAVRELAAGRYSAPYLFAALLISPCVGLVVTGFFGPMISTLKADVLIAAAVAVLAILFAEFTATSPQDQRYLPLGATLLLLTAVLFSIKISAAIFCVVVAAAVLFRLAATVGWRHRVTVLSTSIATLVVGSVLVRGIILSGYPLYPSPILGVNVDWRVPVAQTDAERADIISGAQLRPSYDIAATTGWAWIPAWGRVIIRRDRFNIVLPLLLAVLCLPLLVAVRQRHALPKVIRPGWGCAILTVASVSAVCVWFLQAPAGRFALMYFWVLFAAVFAAGVDQLRRVPLLALGIGAVVTVSLAVYVLYFALGMPRELQWRVALLLVLGVCWTIAASWAVVRRRPRWLAAVCLALGCLQLGDRALAYTVRHDLAQIGPMLWLPIARLSKLAAGPPVLARTRQGLVVYVTASTDYKTPLPNTRFFNPYLELRVPGDMSKGFRNSYFADASRYGYTIRVVDSKRLEQLWNALE